jgi:hypothetical protein
LSGVLVSFSLEKWPGTALFPAAVFYLFSHLPGLFPPLLQGFGRTRAPSPGGRRRVPSAGPGPEIPVGFRQSWAKIHNFLKNFRENLVNYTDFSF